MTSSHEIQNQLIGFGPVFKSINVKPKTFAQKLLGKIIQFKKCRKAAGKGSLLLG